MGLRRKSSAPVPAILPEKLVRIDTLPPDVNWKFFLGRFLSMAKGLSDQMAQNNLDKLPVLVNR